MVASAPHGKNRRSFAGVSIRAWAVRLIDGVKRKAGSSATSTREPAMKFVCLGYGEEKNWDAMTKGEQEAAIEESFAYDDELLKNSNWADGSQALHRRRTPKRCVGKMARYL